MYTASSEHQERERARAHKSRQQAGSVQPVVWQPQPGVQQRAYESTAAQIGYGGSAGGGKSDLQLGLAGTEHRRSIIFRRVFPSQRGMIERSREIFNASDAAHGKDSYNEQLHVWRLAGGHMLEFGSAQYEADLKKYQGQPHDYLGIDEATEFPEKFVRFLMGWNRTTVPGQRCRLVLTFNPPMDDAGSWVVAFFAPWLDEDYPDPAADGDIRYVVRLNDKDVFYRSLDDVPDDARAILVQQAADQAMDDWRAVLKTRTFFHASLKDNPILAASGYGATIEALPEPLRSFLKGKFNAARVTDPWQVIPAEWVRLAQARWRARSGPDVPLQATGVDVAHGGNDQTVITRLYGDWGEQEKHPGRATPRGSHVAALLADDIAEEVPIGIDVIGYGSSAGDTLHDMDGVDVVAVNFSEGAPPDARDKSGKLKFRNLRAYAYWELREALDPEAGENLALPDDPELRADLCAPRWLLSAQGIQIESKDDIKERIGHSPDCGDSYVIARHVQQHYAGSWLLWGA